MVTAEEERFRDSLLDWGDENTREYPWRETSRSLYEVFIAEFFLTQTPADNVASVYPQFIEQFPSLDSLDDASREELVEVIRPLGFYNMRAEALKEIASQRDSIPDSVEELTELPRVGRYIANTTLCIAQNRPLPVLDRNVVRVYDRVFGEVWPAAESDQWEFTERLVPNENPQEYNLILLDFGAMICQPEPQCDVCFATEYCTYYQKHRQ
jgi:A/G-specific adenine glycosylase